MLRSLLLLPLLLFSCASDEAMSYPWVGWDGGPMMLIDAEDFAKWPGSGDFPANTDDDGNYDAVCEALGAAKDYFALFPFEGAQVLVLMGEAEPEMLWVPRPDGAVVAIYDYGEEKESTPDVLRSLPESQWKDSGQGITLRRDRHLLAFAGARKDDPWDETQEDNPDRCEVSLAPGRYRILTAQYAAKDESLALWLVRLRRE